MCQRDRETGNRAAASELPEALLKSYTDAVYRVDFAPTPVFLRVGEACPELDLILERAGVRRFAFLSAANPGSAPLGEEENRDRHQRLLGRLKECGLPAVAGESYEAVSGGWREASLFVAGLEREAAVALAREFGQLALLAGVSGEPVKLVLTSQAKVRD